MSIVTRAISIARIRTPPKGRFTIFFDKIDSKPKYMDHLRVVRNYGIDENTAAIIEASGMTPYYIPVNETFHVFENKQCLLAMDLTVDGMLINEGFIIEVI